MENLNKQKGNTAPYLELKVLDKTFQGGMDHVPL